MFRNILVAVALCGVVSQVQAARVWEIENNYIEEASIYQDTVSGTGYNVLLVKLKNPISTGCALSDSSRTVTYWTPNEPAPAVSLWLSALLSAQAQGLKVDIRTENANCNPTYGRLFQGIRLKLN